MSRVRTDEIATEAFSVLGTGRQIATFSSRHPDFALVDAYTVAARLRELHEARGETAIGRKIGFTNRAVWANHGISGPIWSYVYDSTVKDLAEEQESFSLDGLAEPRVEPEIVLHLLSVPRPDMDDDELLGCIDWIAHAFEVVDSIFPGWAFTAADAIAGHGVHASLLLGRRHSVSGDRSKWAAALPNFSIVLMEEGGASRRGHGSDVLGGPVRALRFLLDELARFPDARRLAAGEIVTTGTLTEAMPAVAGDTWTTVLSDIDIEGIRVRFR